MEKIAFVTGADRGLGFAMTAGLLDRGWRVFAGQFLPDWPDLAALAAAHPDRLTPIPLDVADAGSVAAAAQQVAAQTDRLDMLVNNAGINPGAFQQTIREGVDFALMQTVYAVNSIGPLRMTEAFLPLMGGDGMNGSPSPQGGQHRAQPSQRLEWLLHVPAALRRLDPLPATFRRTASPPAISPAGSAPRRGTKARWATWAGRGRYPR
jgi:NAD(P)-dependent dehydrogenase (short-subunit alcohol dehydrogenase family)